MVRGMEKPPSDSWYLISIYSWPDPPVLNEKTIKNAKETGCHKYLSLDFGDLTVEKYENAKKAYPDMAKNLILFNKEHAKAIIDFTEEMQRDEKECDLIVHCHAGISRSGAVACFISNKTGVGFIDWEIRPNPYVTKVLEEVEGRSYTKEAREKWRKQWGITSNEHLR